MWWPVYLIAVVFVYWLYWRWKNRRLLQLAAMFPGPRALPIIGNGFMVITHTGERFLDLVENLFKKYGDYCRFWLGPELNICVKNPEDIRFLLTSNKVNQKGSAYDLMKAFIGPGILSGGPTWRSHRKIATPSYSKRAVKLYSAIFNKEAKVLVDLLLKKESSLTFNVYYDVVDITTQCVCQTLMGLSKDDSLNVNGMNKFILETQQLYDLIFTKMTVWWLQIPVIYWLTGRKATEDAYIKKVDNLTSDILEKRLKALEESNTDEEAMGIVDRYILSGELTKQEIKWETMSLFTTSQEASAKIVSAVLLFLAHLPDWQEKVYTEIIEVLGPELRDVTADELKHFHYLDMVYQEVLRYLSIAALIQRTVEEEITINSGKFTLPVGTTLVIPIHDLHRDPRYWDEPLKVKPERFLPENIKKRNPNVFIPFSLGAMDCLGRVYAEPLIKILVVWVIRQMKLEAKGCIEDLKLHVAISVKFADGYNLNVKPRN